MASFTRRSFFSATVAALAAPSLAAAAAPAASRQGPGVYRSRLGAFELTALYDGVWYQPIEGALVRNASRDDVNKALTDAFLAPDVLPINFTALLVNTGSRLVLIDTGTAGQLTDSAGTLPDNLAVAGIRPADIDTIVISHFHPDHIDGLKTKDGDKVFPNAEIKVPEPEWAFWMDEASLHRNDGSTSLHLYFLNARRIFRDIAKEVTRFTPGREVAAGITSIAAFGHTPGHCAFAVSSGSSSLLVVSDTARLPALFVRHPEWQPTFDMDGPRAAATRKAMLDRAAADRMLVQGYHFPFPGSGHIVRTASGFDFAPAMWRPLSPSP
jgi:glyoxylase-like metal-dependent hydrolase (beta-lactamase superfamily II)